MRILYIDHYAGSSIHGMEFRPFYLSREWVKSGHRVRVLAASYSHLRSVQPKLEPANTQTTESIEGIEYCWYPTPRHGGNGIGRARNIVHFLFHVWAQARRIAASFQPDLVIASSTYPMDIWVARRIARKARAKLVFELHDIWPLSLIELGHFAPSHLFVRLCDFAARTAYRDSDVIISMLPKFGDFLRASGGDAGKVTVIPNGMNPDDWKDTPPPLTSELKSFVGEQKALNRLLIAYTGSHGKANALDVLLDAAKLVRDEPFSFVLLGDGPEKPRLILRAKQEGLHNVHFFSPVPKPQVGALLAQIDVAYIGWEPLPMYRFGISPNKLIDYMMGACVVLHSVDAANDLVQEAGCGICVKPGDPQLVCGALRRLAATSPADRAAMGAKGRDFALRNLAYPVLAARFLKAVQP